MDAEFYNEASALKLGWTPDWFGCSYFDEDLTEAIKQYQKDNGLKADGLCGPGTYRRIWTDRQSKLRYLHEDVLKHFEARLRTEAYIPVTHKVCWLSFFYNFSIPFGQFHSAFHKRKNNLWPINVIIVIVINDTGVVVLDWI